LNHKGHKEHKEEEEEEKEGRKNRKRKKPILSMQQLLSWHFDSYAFSFVISVPFVVQMH
jgi:hypothetical protein